MSEISFDPNDPRLTDYVLGELADADRAAIERLLEVSPEARAAVDELLEISGLLTESFSSEQAPALTAEQRTTVETAVKNASHSVRARRRSLHRAAGVLVSTAAMIATGWLVVVAVDRSTETSAQVEVAAQSLDGLPSARYLRDHVQLFSSPYSDQLSSSELQSKIAGGEDINGLYGTMNYAYSQGSDGTWSIDFGDDGDLGGYRGPYNGNPGADSTLPTPFPANRNLIQGQSTAFGRPGTQQLGVSREALIKVPVDDSSLNFHGEQFATAKGESPSKDGANKATVSKLVIDNIHVELFGMDHYSVSPGVDVPQGSHRNLADRSDLGITPPLDGRDNETTGESYEPIVENSFLLPQAAPLSTFSIDVDTASYANTRRFLRSRQRVPPNAVRIEELVNYFHYDDPAPTDGKPFAVQMEMANCPWQADHRLLRVALKGREIPRTERPPTNLVFLLDVSGSMRDANKLPLVQQAMKLLVAEMTEDDRIAIVTYAGNAGLVLDSTSGDKQETILGAIDNLSAGGSTNGEAGIHLAYSKAVEHLYKQGSNRVILCTDGDFNVGTSDDDELVTLIQEKAGKSQVFLSVFGFGMGNLKDAKLEKLADKGNGHYAYVDSLREAKKVFVEDLTGTLYTIAKDVKLQIEFNPAKVGAYRLIGYENRIMPAEHFDDDTKDAGEIGAGHSVTALYEIVPLDKLPVAAKPPALKYQKKVEPKQQPQPELKQSNDLLTLSLRYKQPEGETSEKLEFPLADAADESLQGTRELNWTAAVASFGMLLRGSQFRGEANFGMVLELAEASRGDDPAGHRGEFIELVKAAQSLYDPNPTAPSPEPNQPANPQ